MKHFVWLLASGMTCFLPTVSADAAQAQATLLMWEEQEAGVAPYSSRMLVTENYLRSDDGHDDGDFILFDRQTQRIYSVSHEQRSVLVIEASQPPEMVPLQPPLQDSLQPDPEAPKIAGQSASHFQLSSGDQVCLQATVVPGLMPDVVAALREMQAVLAARQYRDLDKTPEDYRTPCFMANYIYAIDRHLQAGFPVLELRQDGWQRALLDFHSDQPVAAELFSVPKGYSEERLQ
ncbi:MAG: hypothetical protein KKA36_02790 [Gammaproteobacteria bacterium]|nr:hypothetical protein [Gammaproteobacteria bacterium]MBU2477990.1 hypothetical protein [Gammaproteobacteria bacterium]